jgi:RecA-family ATPase
VKPGQLFPKEYPDLHKLKKLVLNRKHFFILHSIKTKKHENIIAGRQPNWNLSLQHRDDVIADSMQAMVAHGFEVINMLDGTELDHCSQTPT